MINKPLLFKSLHSRIPILIPIKGRGLMNNGSTLGMFLVLLTFGVPTPADWVLAQGLFWKNIAAVGDPRIFSEAHERTSLSKNASLKTK